MSYHKTATLPDRLRALAEELESAQRYGLPIPDTISVHGFPNYSAHVSFSANEAEFDVWADYTEADVTEYEHADHRWERAEADVNGLLVSFAIMRGPVEAARESQPSVVSA